jgi:hypothetical protein
MRDLRKICIFCGSRFGAQETYREATIRLARLLAEQNIGLVYGGASVGLMGLLADTMEAHGGEVIGVIPQWLVDKEVARTTLADLRIVGSMHERKAVMAELSDAFIALPGGFGTLEEIFEALTWNQLALQDKPCGLLNVAGFYDQLLRFLQHAVSERLLHPAYAAMLHTADTPEQLLIHLQQSELPHVAKWTDALAQR